MKNRDIISEIRSTHKLLSSDNSINDRTVLKEARSAASKLIKQRLDRRLLYQSPNIFSVIDCLEMEPAPIAECCEYNSDKMIAKSKHPLPRIAEGNFGLAISGVFGIEQNIKLKELTPTRYVNLTNLGLADREVYFWVMPNRHIYATSEVLSTLKVIFYTEEDIPDYLQYPECGCNNKKKDDCPNPLDDEFKCPGFLIDDLKNIVSQRLLSSYFRVPVDQTSDNKDDATNRT